MSRCFVVKAEFITSPIITRRLNFDALLAHLLYKDYLYAGEDHEDAINHAHATIPLDTLCDTFCGSCALIPTTTKIDHVFIQSLDSHITTWLEADTYVAKTEKKRINSSEFQATPTAIMRRFSGTSLALTGLPLYFMARGDIDAVRLLLEPVRNLGKKHNIGHGRLKQPLEVTEVEGYEHFGVVTRDKVLLRPITEKAFDVFKPKTYDVAFDAVRVPYWQSEKVGCYVPKGLTFAGHDLTDMIEDTE